MFFRIIRSHELSVHYRKGSQWSMFKEIVRIKQTVELSVVELSGAYCMSSVNKSEDSVNYGFI